ncbi:TonB-dependent receptor [Litoribaculum gwangyangense]|uniref:TonB-dependent receptor plug domain-containing protein n=1 Tax=Litoribaculum gwangyangense TaxID=1130722 RepID=A0ABP9CV59_9FLAO
MEVSIKKNITFFLILFVFSVAQSQNTEKQEPLVYILNAIQKAYEVQFNYAEDSIEGVFLEPPAENLKLKDILYYLETTTSLTFSMMGDGIILVSPKIQKMTFCGYLKDNETLKPLVGATIQTGNNSTITNEDGFFEIKIDHISKPITIRFLGYKTILKQFEDLSTTNCDDIFLIPNVQLLSEIVVSNYITNGINKINNGSYEINFSRFEILPGLINNDVLQSVQAFPGIQSVNETVSNINIRGGAHDQNLILWDGIKMYQSGHFFGLISMYNPQITQKVSLRKNGTDVSYSDGVSGTISMQTNKNINTNFKGVAEINLTDFSGFFDVPLSDVSSVQIAARKSINDFLETPTYNAFFDRISQNTEISSNLGSLTNTNEEFDFYDTSLRWIYKLSDKDNIQLNFINVHNQLQFNENATVEGEEASRESRLNQNSIAGALHYDRLWNDYFKTALEIYETDYKLKAINVNLLDAQRFLQENIVSETSVKLKSNYKVNELLQFLLGYQFIETEVTNLDDVDIPRFRNLVSEVLRTHGVFSQIAYRSPDNMTNLNLGVRYNYISKFNKSIWEPRLSFNHQFLNHFSLDIQGEFKHQNTSQVINFQNDFLGVEKRRWQLSNNRDIPVITSKQISIGLNYNNIGWLFGIEGFYKMVNGITTQSQGFQNQYEFVKSNGEYNVTGIDVLIRKHFNKFNSWLSYSYMNNRYLFKDLEDDFFPSNYNVIQTITLGTAYKWNHLKLSAGLNWHSGKPITLPVLGNEIVDNEVNFGSTNASNLIDYARLDISAIYDFKLNKKAKANLGISVWNVLDKENQINNFYRVNNENIIETQQSSLGITPNAVFRVHF